MLSSLLPNSRDLTRLTRCGVTTMRVGNIKLPFVHRLAEKDSVEGPVWFDSPAWPDFNDALILASFPLIHQSRSNTMKAIGAHNWSTHPANHVRRVFQTSDSIAKSQPLQEPSGCITLTAAFVYNRAFHLSSRPSRRNHCHSTKQSMSFGSRS